jgi:hypothetical protein
LGGIDPVLQHIEIKSGEVQSAEAMKAMIKDMKFVRFISPANPLDQSLQLMEGKTVDLHEFRVRDAIGAGIEIVKVSQEIAEGVADLAVSFGKLPEDLLRDADIVSIVLRSDPEAQDLGPKPIDHLLRGYHISQ